jgi:hypothetical protein
MIAYVLQIAFLFIFFIALVIPNAWAYELPQVQNVSFAKIDELTNEIALKEIDLERYYLRYRVLGTHESQYSYLRYSLLQEIASSTILAGEVTYLYESGKNLNTPQKLSTGVLKGATTLNLIGSAVQGTSSGIELCSSGLVALKNKIHKADPKTARLEAIKRLKEIDALIEKRDVLVQTVENKTLHDFYQTEGDLLKSARGGCAYEFAEVYAHVRSYQPGDNVYYVLDVVSSSLYTASNVLALQSFNRPNLIGTSAIVGFVGDCIALPSAPLNVLAYKYLYRFWHKRLAKQMNEKFIDSTPQIAMQMIAFKDAIKKLANEYPALASEAKIRFDIYELYTKRYDQYIEKVIIDLKHREKVALQSAVSGPLISGTYFSQGIVDIISAYRYKHNPRRSNTLGFYGTIAPTIGSSASCILTAKSYIQTRRYENKLRKQKALPEDLLKERLATLKEMENTIARLKAQNH